MKTTMERLNEMLIACLIAVIIFFLVTRFYIPVQVAGFSMFPTLMNGERLMLSRYAYNNESPQHGDIIMFKLVGYTEDYFIKRVIAVEGETIEIKNNEVYVNNIKLDEPYLVNTENGADMGPLTLEENEYFVMGDNREDSLDSRSFGKLLEDEIFGRVIMKGE